MLANELSFFSAAHGPIGDLYDFVVLLFPNEIGDLVSGGSSARSLSCESGGLRRHVAWRWPVALQGELT